MRSLGGGGLHTGRRALVTRPPPAKRSPTRTLKLAALGSLLLCAACPRQIVLPDDRIPHQIATETTVEVWCHDPSDSTRWVKCEVRAMEGWWLASPRVVDPSPSEQKP
jgi:hypothetical protein